MTTSVTLHMVDAEPRIHDLELARRLAYAAQQRYETSSGGTLMNSHAMEPYPS
ncbi:hypothetical protein [Rhizobium ruizarguesonis]|uniref:hypothetical protein n=1 Tax=Rhizobium ruizarguesonis TaxID=2081791 RepID=UPI0013C03F5A|nr:hypothetical protein [Rhizobium ruizarguesonis]NEH29211.1 hypothetical protein [Rhizobium ruizarguesonis]NEK07160.1 hypothetical protein [Rhizobium ruizarguesonis]